MQKQEQDIIFADYSLILEDEEEPIHGHDNLISESVSASVNNLILSLSEKQIACSKIYSNYIEYPLSFLTTMQIPKKDKQHYKFVEPVLISGIVDCIQIYYSYTIEPSKYFTYLFVYF